MKKMFRKFLVVLCVLSATLSLAGCGKEKEVVNYSEETVVQYTNQVLKTLEQVGSAELKAQETSMDEETYEFWSATMESWESAMGDLGALSSVDGISSSSDEENITVLADITGTTGRTAQVEFIMDKRYNPVSCATNVNRSIGENMTNAALNTLLGMGTVFVVLIFISFIIALFKQINVIEKKMSEKKNAPKESPAAAAADKAVAQIIETEELSDDLELVAVISAAIAAFEEAAGGSGDGYVVRSIKRRA